ncbi:glycosyltransferase family 2 protein [Salinirubrum litoreum]|uniref:Glycosyltransferase family 2 protein n=1 Tax=Salinirubrum litoreum TaxID=1126234 RepID=A0ABD5REL3_9EURY|nr:glycosyltransferase family A protein [Salinirubrum litoreum]
MPLVSALIPTYDRAEFVAGAVESALAQTHPDVEVVVCDDGSTDETSEVLAQFAADDRVRVVHHETNRGVAAANNTAAAAATGDFYCILGDDDRWHPEKVERQLARFADAPDDCGLVYTGGVLASDERVTREYTPNQRGDVYPDILRRFDLHPHSSHMLRREAFESIGGFDESMPRGVDWEFTIRLAREWTVEYVDDCLTRRTFHEGNLSESPDQSFVHRLIWERHGDEIRQHPGIERGFRQDFDRMLLLRALKDGEWSRATRYGLRALRRQQDRRALLMFGLGVAGPLGYRVAAPLRRTAVDRATAFDYPDWATVAAIAPESASEPEYAAAN